MLHNHSTTTYRCSDKLDQVFQLFQENVMFSGKIALQKSALKEPLTYFLIAKISSSLVCLTNDQLGHQYPFLKKKSEAMCINDQIFVSSLVLLLSKWLSKLDQSSLRNRKLKNDLRFQNANSEMAQAFGQNYKYLVRRIMRPASNIVNLVRHEFIMNRITSHM